MFTQLLVFFLTWISTSRNASGCWKFTTQSFYDVLRLRICLYGFYLQWRREIGPDSCDRRAEKYMLSPISLIDQLIAISPQGRHFRTIKVAVTASKTRGARLMWSCLPSSQLASITIDANRGCETLSISNVGACKIGQDRWKSAK